MVLNKMMKVGCGSVMLSSMAMGADQARTDKLVDIQAKVRADLVSNRTNTMTSAATNTDSEDGFKLAMARLYLLGAMNEGRTRYTLNIDPLSISKVGAAIVTNSGPCASAATASGCSRATSDVDNANSVLVEASLTHMPTKMLAIKIGRIGVNAGGIENNFYSPFDTYMTSYFGNLTELGQVGTGIEVGVTPMEGHTVKIQVLNGLQGSPAAEKAGGNMTTGITYQGDVAGMMKPYVSVYQHRYTKSKYNNPAVPGAQTQYDPNNAMSYSIGAQFLVADLVIDGEYDAVSWVKTKSVINGNTGDDGSKNQNYSGGIVQVAYKLPSLGLRPWLKLTNENHKKGRDSGTCVLAASTCDIAYMSYGVGAEWFAEKNLNYHFAYTVANTTTKDGDTSNNAIADLKATANNFLVGAGVSL